MSLDALRELSPSRWADFLSFDKTPYDIPMNDGEDQDLFVRSNTEIKMTLPNDRSMAHRDIVVLGSLTVKALDLNKEQRPSFIARNVFVTGPIVFKNVDQKFGHFEGIEKGEFLKNLHQLLTEWIALQREVVQKLGLKPILICPTSQL